MRATHIAAVVVALLAGLVTAAALSEGGGGPARYRVVVVDASWSRDSADLCRQVVALALAGAPEDGSIPYSVQLLSTGESRDGGSSRALGGRLTLQPSGGIVEGTAVRSKAVADLRSATEANCKALRRTATSPILEALRGARENLNDLGCGQKGIQCELVAASDGDENFDPHLTALLRGVKPNVPAKVLDLRGIDRLTICGLHQRRGEAGGRRPPVILEVEAAWRQEVSDPTKLVFLATCPES